MPAAEATIGLQRWRIEQMTPIIATDDARLVRMEDFKAGIADLQHVECGEWRALLAFGQW